MSMLFRMNISTAQQQRCTPLDRSVWFQLHVRFKINTLNVQLNEMLLEEIFTQYGPVADCTIKEYNVNLDLRTVSGYAFVYYYTVDIANAAIQGINQNNGYLSDIVHFRANFAYEIKDGHHDDFDMPERAHGNTGHFSSQPYLPHPLAGRASHGAGRGEPVRHKMLGMQSNPRGYPDNLGGYRVEPPSYSPMESQRMMHPSSRYGQQHPYGAMPLHGQPSRMGQAGLNSSFDPHGQQMFKSFPSGNAGRPMNAPPTSTSFYNNARRPPAGNSFDYLSPSYGNAPGYGDDANYMGIARPQPSMMMDFGEPRYASGLGDSMNANNNAMFIYANAPSNGLRSQATYPSMQLQGPSAAHHMSMGQPFDTPTVMSFASNPIAPVSMPSSTDAMSDFTAQKLGSDQSMSGGNSNSSAVTHDPSYMG